MICGSIFKLQATFILRLFMFCCHHVMRSGNVAYSTYSDKTRCLRARERQRISSKTFFDIVFQLLVYFHCSILFSMPDLLLSPLAIACPHRTLHPPSFGKASSQIPRKKNIFFSIFFSALTCSHTP